MAERRSLAAGLEVVPDGVDATAMRAFISQDKPTPQPVPVPGEPANAEGEGTTAAETRPAAAPAKKAVRAAVPANRNKMSPLHANILVPVTVRLKPEIADALKRASLHRQLNGDETYTQQDIVEEALTPWLRTEGLLD